MYKYQNKWENRIAETINWKVRKETEYVGQLESKW